MKEIHVSPTVHYSAFERLTWSLAGSFLVLLALSLGLHDFWQQYYPGQEDASLIMEAMRFNPHYWLHAGYFEWFNVHPGEQPVVDYEIRPLTHLITWMLYQVAGERWWVYPAFNALIAAAFAGVTINFVLSSSRHWLISIAALVLVLGFNPANSVEFLIDHSFYQVLLSSVLFLLMYQQWLARRYLCAAVICVLGVVLKESAWFYPGVILLLFLNECHSEQQWPRLRQWMSASIAVLGSAGLFIAMHPEKLLSSDVAVFSIGMYADGMLTTFLNGVSLLPHYWQGPYGFGFSLLCATAVCFAYKKFPASRQPLCLLLPTLFAGWLFHEELRWTHELTLAWIAFLLCIRGRLLVLLGLITAMGWATTSAPRLAREWQETREYGFYAHSYRKPFITAAELTRVSDTLNLNTLLVVNDPIRMNGDYYSLMSQARVNWVTLNSIDYPYDNRFPDESPHWKGRLLLLSKAGDMGFMGFQGHQDGWLDGKHYGGDVRVLKALTKLSFKRYPHGEVRFHHKGQASIIEHVGELPRGVAYAYFWRDSKDAWLFYADVITGKLSVRLVSPYARAKKLGYEVDIPIRSCTRHQVEWTATQSDAFKLKDCHLRGHLLPGQFLSLQVKEKGKIIWAYVMRAPDDRVILNDTQEILYEQQKRQ